MNASDILAAAYALERVLRGATMERLRDGDQEALRQLHALLVDAGWAENPLRETARELHAAGFSIAEIARRLGRPRTTVSSWVHRKATHKRRKIRG